MTIFIQAQQTNSIIMVRPDDFGFNPQTGLDNEFQHKPNKSLNKGITQNALIEFSNMVSVISKHNIDVL